jgi:hypothetical protein
MEDGMEKRGAMSQSLSQWFQLLLSSKHMAVGAELDIVELQQLGV